MHVWNAVEYTWSAACWLGATAATSDERVAGGTSSSMTAQKRSRCADTNYARRAGRVGAAHADHRVEHRDERVREHECCVKPTAQRARR